MAADIRLGDDPVVTVVAEDLELVRRSEPDEDGRRFKAMSHGDDGTLTLNADRDFARVAVSGELRAQSVNLENPGDDQSRVTLQASGLVRGLQLEATRRVLVRKGKGRFEAEVEDDRVAVLAGGPRMGEGGTQNGLDGHVSVMSGNGVDRVDLDGRNGMVHATKLVRSDEGTFQEVTLGSGDDVSSMKVVDRSLTIAPGITVGGRNAVLPRQAAPLGGGLGTGIFPPGTIPGRPGIVRPILSGTDGSVEVHSRLRGATITLDGATGTVDARDITLPELGSLIDLLGEIKQRLGL